MRIHVCIRSTLDWSDRGLVEARILPQFRLKLQAWNATFNMPYHRFRQRVCEVAALNLGRIEGAAHSAIEDVPPGDLIVPVDDDDWFAPDLADRLQRAHEPRARCYLWSQDVIELPRRIRGSLHRLARWLGRKDRFICGTNNYAVVSAAALVPLALNHVKASRHFDRRPADIKRVSGTLAIQNRTLASQTVLAWHRPSISRQELVTLLHRYRGLYGARAVRPELSWARPYVDMMAELMREIHVR